MAVLISSFFCQMLPAVTVWGEYANKVLPRQLYPQDVPMDFLWKWVIRFNALKMTTEVFNIITPYMVIDFA